MYSLLAVIWFIITIYALYLVLTGRSEAMMKLVWVLVILLLPVLGPILFFVIGRSARA